MKIRIIWAGRTKERFLRDGIGKYLELLKPYAEVEIIEVRGAKDADPARCREAEGERILRLQTPFVLLDEAGEQMTSVGFAGLIGKSGARMSFVIGGAYGVADQVRQAAERTISLSRMTFTHDMARLILLEQVFRAFSILNRRGYHH